MSKGISSAFREAAPLAILVNGYEFNPTKPMREKEPQKSSNPHARIFHFDEYPPKQEHDNHSSGWPGRLGFAKETSSTDGLAVAFGWHSDYGLHLDAYNAASDRVVWSLIAVLDAISARRPNQRIDFVAHSLGTHLVLQALRRCAELFPDLAARVRRVILMGGSEFVAQAQDVYDSLLKPQPDLGNQRLADDIEIYNIVCWTDDVVGTVSQIATLGPNDEKDMIGKFGLERGTGLAGWMDIQLDDETLQEWIRDRFGLAVDGDRPGEWLDHWYYFTNAQNTALYARILRDADDMSHAALRTNAIPEGVPSNT